MVTKTMIVSDLSGKPNTVETHLGLDRDWYSLDLTADERGELERVLHRYLDAGRRIGVVRARTDQKRAVPDTTAEQREQIRSWARQNGYDLAERGQIPKRIFAAYVAAHDDGDAAQGQ